MDIKKYNVERYAHYYSSLKNWNMRGQDAVMFALAALAIAIDNTAAHICDSINMDDHVPSIGEGLVMIADAINNLEAHDD